MTNSWLCRRRSHVGAPLEFLVVTAEDQDFSEPDPDAPVLLCPPVPSQAQQRQRHGGRHAWRKCNGQELGFGFGGQARGGGSFNPVTNATRLCLARTPNQGKPACARNTHSDASSNVSVRVDIDSLAQGVEETGSLAGGKEAGAADAVHRGCVRTWRQLQAGRREADRDPGESPCPRVHCTQASFRLWPPLALDDSTAKRRSGSRASLIRSWTRNSR